MQRHVLWTRLRNAHSELLFPSNDWEMLIFDAPRYFSRDGDRWIEAEGAWRWTAEEAAAVAEQLEQAGAMSPGLVSVDEDTGFMSTHNTERVLDGATPQERMSRLLRFLREGECTWRYIEAEPHAPPTAG